MLKLNLIRCILKLFAQSFAQVFPLLLGLAQPAVQGEESPPLAWEHPQRRPLAEIQGHQAVAVAYKRRWLLEP